jgi:hypothetical protein
MIRQKVVPASANGGVPQKQNKNKTADFQQPSAWLSKMY